MPNLKHMLVENMIFGGSVFSRSNLKYYTSEQLSSIDYSDSSSMVTRIASNDETLFTYEAKSNGGDFLKVAENVWNKVCSTFTTYGGTTVPPKGKTIDCSAYVSWVLYEYGYTEFGGSQTNTEKLYTTNWNQKYGWEEISVAAGENVVSKLQPGDILVRRGASEGHTQIVVSVEDSGAVYVYDCGDESNWIGKNGKPMNYTKFAAFDSRPGKIIRVTAPQI